VLRESHAHKEGGERRFSIVTKAFLGENQVVKRLLCEEVEWSPASAAGPGRPVEKPGAEFELDADLVILAMGFWGPGNGALIKDMAVDLDERGNVKAAENQMTSVDRIFVAGDMTTGQSLVVRAIASGRKTARHIISHLREERE